MYPDLVKWYSLIQGNIVGYFILITRNMAAIVFLNFFSNVYYEIMSFCCSSRLIYATHTCILDFNFLFNDENWKCMSLSLDLLNCSSFHDTRCHKSTTLFFVAPEGSRYQWDSQMLHHYTNLSTVIEWAKRKHFFSTSFLRCVLG